MGTETTKYRIVLEDKLSADLKKALTQADAFDDSMKGINKSTKKTGISLKAAFGGLALGAAFAFVGKKIFDLGVNMEQTRISFETFLGSKSAANRVIDELNEFSNVTPFENDQVLRAGKSLLAFGLEADKLKTTLRAIGDISSGTGKDFNELSLIYGKAMTQGRIQGEELNQLSEAGIPIIKEFAKMFGVAEADIKKMGSEGKISFADLETAFQNMNSEGGMFFNLMEKQSQSLGGKLSTLVGKLQLVGAAIGEGMTGSLGKFADALINFVDDQTPAIVSSAGQISTAFFNMGSTIDKVYSKLIGEDGNFWGDMLDEATFVLTSILDTITFMINQLGVLGIAIKGAFQFMAGNFDEADMEFARAGTLSRDASGEFDAAMLKNHILAGHMGKAAQDALRNAISSDEEGLGEGAGTTGGAGGLGAAGGTGTGGKGSKLSGDVAGVQSKVKNITINIDKMVENIAFNNITSKQSEAELVEMIKRSLLTAVNDVNVIAR